jgi:hypothetical protein
MDVRGVSVMDWSKVIEQLEADAKRLIEEADASREASFYSDMIVGQVIGFIAKALRKGVKTVN